MGPLKVTTGQCKGRKPQTSPHVNQDWKNARHPATEAVELDKFRYRMMLYSVMVVFYVITFAEIFNITNAPNASS